MSRFPGLAPRTDNAAQRNTGYGSSLSPPGKLPPMARDHRNDMYRSMQADHLASASPNKLIFKPVSRAADGTERRASTPLTLQSMTMSNSASLSRTPLSGSTATSQIREQLSRMNYELSLLEEQERQAQLERQQEEERKQRLIEQEQRRHEREMAELQALADAEGAIFRERAKQERLQRQQTEAAAAARLASTQKQPPGDIRGLNEIEEMVQSKVALQSDLKQLYSEMKDLEDPRWIKKQVMQEKLAYAERLQAQEDMRHAKDTRKPSTTRQEILRLREETAALERQQSLAEDRRRAVAEELWRKRQEERDQQVQELEAARAKTAAAVAQAQRRPTSAELGTQPRRMAPMGSLSRPLPSEAERRSIQREDALLQQARQKHDLDLLRAERAVMLQDDQNTVQSQKTSTPCLQSTTKSSAGRELELIRAEYQNLLEDADAAEKAAIDTELTYHA